MTYANSRVFFFADHHHLLKTKRAHCRLALHLCSLGRIRIQGDSPPTVAHYCSRMDPEQASEITPLITHRDDRRYIDPEVSRRMTLERPDDMINREGHWYNEDPVDRAYEVIVLLRLMAHLRTDSVVRNDGDELTPDLETQRKLRTLGTALTNHGQFLDSPTMTMKDLKTFLLASFPLNERSREEIRGEYIWG